MSNEITYSAKYVTEQENVCFPLSAIVGMEDLVLSLLLVAREPKLGGVLLTGDKGTAKTTAARSLAMLLGHKPFVDLPLGITEDRLLGSVDYSKVLKDSKFEYKPGILAQANGGVLYVDEINLLAPYLTDALLDSQTTGYLNVQRDGMSLRIETKYVLIGSMNPEEGILRPQLLDRFGLTVNVTAPRDVKLRKQIVYNRLKYNENPESFYESYRLNEERLSKAVGNPIDPKLSDEIVHKAVEISTEANVQGLRSDIVLVLAARALAGLMGSSAVQVGHLMKVAPFVLNHRTSKHLSELIGADDAELTTQTKTHPIEAILSGESESFKGGKTEHVQSSNEIIDSASTESNQGSSDNYTSENYTSENYTGENYSSDNAKRADNLDESDLELNANTSKSKSTSASQLNSPDSKFPNTKNPNNLEYGSDVSGSAVNSGSGDNEIVTQDHGHDDGTVTVIDYAGMLPNPYQVNRINNVLKIAKLRQESTPHKLGSAEPQSERSPFKLVDANSADSSNAKLSIIGTIFEAISECSQRGSKLDITYDHLRFKQVQKNSEIVVVLVLDVSKSVGAAKRLEFAKEFINSLFQSIYQTRIKVAIYTFGKDRIDLICEPTGSVEFVKEKLKSLKFEGNTPLYMALEKVLNDLLKLKSEDKIPFVIFVTDGKAKVTKEVTWGKLLNLATKYKTNQIMTSIVPIGEINDFSIGLIEDLKLATGAVDI
jgi:magnesium chelatase subunit D